MLQYVMICPPVIFHIIMSLLLSVAMKGNHHDFIEPDFIASFISSQILFLCSICPSTYELNYLFSIFDETVMVFL